MKRIIVKEALIGLYYDLGKMIDEKRSGKEMFDLVDKRIARIDSEMQRADLKLVWD